MNLNQRIQIHRNESPDLSYSGIHNKIINCNQSQDLILGDALLFEILILRYLGFYLTTAEETLEMCEREKN